MKAAGAFASLLRGVSQQSPEVRQPGQHGEQVNLLSDPVAGLARRHGTRRRAAQALPTPGSLATMLAASQGYRELTHIAEGKEYFVLIRETLADVAYSTGNTAYSPPVICYNKTDNVFVPLAADAATLAALTQIGQRGISACVSIGRFFCFAAKGLAVTSTATQAWNIPSSARLIIWIRGGAYDRTYTVRLSGGATFAYTTPAAGVAGAATAISPQNIAAQLVIQIAAAGFGVSIEGSHIYIAALQDVSVTDGGDNTLIRGIYTTTDSVDKLPILALNDMIVRVQTGPDSFFYVKASAPSTSSPLLNQATWIETGGSIQGSAVSNFGIACIEGGTLRLSLSPSTLAATTVPQFVPSTAGDGSSNPAPQFLQGRPITYMGVFQDRLVVAAGAALSVSAAGDYFNFFRSSVVTVPLKDGFEMIAQGGEDDYLRYSVTYSKNLVLFGDKRQYLVSGQQALTPTSANMSIMTTYADAAEVGPIAAGGQVYYARNREGSVAVHQIQPGTYVDSAESFPASGQIGTYIKAPAAQLEIVSGSPSQLLVRSRSNDRNVYSFTFLDQPDGRKQNAWSRWEFNAANGALLSMVNTPDGVLLFWLRPGAAGTVGVVADLLPLSAEIDDTPYLDSSRPWATVGAPEVLASDTVWRAAFKRPSERYLIGGAFAEIPGLLTEYPTEATYMVAGIPFDAYVEPTNPFPRDGQGLAQLTGRTVITKYSISMKDSAGCVATVMSGSQTASYTFNARVLGSLLNQIGKIPVASSVHSVAIGRESRDYVVRLAALKWFPFALIGIEWTGQSFNRTPRV